MYNALKTILFQKDNKILPWEIKL